METSDKDFDGGEMKDLPKALSDREREYVGHHALAAGKRALALIDALTEQGAQQAAQIVLDGRRIAELEQRAEVLRRTSVVGQLEAKVRELETRVMTEFRFGQEQMKRAEAAEARVRELEAERRKMNTMLDEAIDENDELEQKLADANALLKDLADCVTTADGPEARRAYAHLDGQPAAPSRTEAKIMAGGSEAHREADLEDKCERLTAEYKKLRRHYLKAENLLRDWLVDAEGFCPAAQTTRDFLSGHPNLAYFTGHPAAPSRTEAEQAVLDACTAIVFCKWEGATGVTGDSLSRLIAAEMARRGLK